MDCNTSIRALVRCRDLLTAVQSVEQTTTWQEQGICLTFEPRRLTLQDNGKTPVKMTTEIAAEICGNNGKAHVMLNPKFLIDMLQSLGADTMLSFDMNGYDPVLIMPGDAYQYLVMPMGNETRYRVEKDDVDIGKARKEQEKAEVDTATQTDET